MKMIDSIPLEYKGREDVMVWICEMHNTVNSRLGKEIFPCNKVKEIWGQKSCGCNVGKK